MEGQWDASQAHPAALHPRPRERGLGARGRLRGRPTSRGGHRDPAPNCSPAGCAGPAGRATTCTAPNRQFPGPVPRRRDGRATAHLGAGLIKLDPKTQPQRRRGPGRRRASPPTTPREGRSRCCTPGPRAVSSGPAASATSASSAWPRSPRPRSSWSTATPRRPQARRAARRATTPWSRTATRWLRSGESPGAGRQRGARLRGRAGGAENDGWAMTGRAGATSSSATAARVTIPTLDIITTERNIIGNIVGTYNELAELMVLAAGSGHAAHQDLPAGRRAGGDRRSRRGAGQGPRHSRALAGPARHAAPVSH